MSGLSIRPLLVVLATAVLAACQVPGLQRPDSSDAHAGKRAELTTVVADLRVYLGDDPYRQPRARTASGQNVFDDLLWRIDHLSRTRRRAGLVDPDVDAVIEYARARTLERLRRYEQAAMALERVAVSGSPLAAPAIEALPVMELFARGAPFSEPASESAEELRDLGDAPSADDPSEIERRVDFWRLMAVEYAGTPYEALAREESEAWEILQVERIARTGPVDAAIRACLALLDHNRSSKLRSEHFIRLGDLYAAAARGEYTRFRAVRNPFDVARYDLYMERAFSAYEMAREARRPAARREAMTRIEALLAYHEGVRARVR